MRQDETYSYDQVPYPASPFAQTHPQRLATIATLFGVSAPPVDSCRVLEIGCAQGGNIVPMAEQLPNSQFVGFDLSAKQIDAAQQFAAVAKLDNVQLLKMDVLDVPDDMGAFDYILCHGVYSWVPSSVQEAILALCKNHLQTNGVAYVSYNTYPGWHLRGMIRDMMAYHTRKLTDPEQRIAQARALLQFLAGNADAKTAYGMLLKGELDILLNHSDSYLFHEHLEEVNDPVYFFQLAERLDKLGLQYLGEASMPSMWTGHLPSQVAATIQNVAGDLIQMEQYMDFVRNRTFRQSLLCHAEVHVDRQLKPCSLQSMFLASSLVAEDTSAELHTTTPLRFQHRHSGQSLTTSNPMMKAAVTFLSSVWPTWVPFDQVCIQAQREIGTAAVLGAQEHDDLVDYLGRSFLECYVSDLIEIRTAPSRFRTDLAQRPIASRVARAQAGMSAKLVTNLRHEQLPIDEFCRQVLLHLDGTVTREHLLQKVRDLIQRGVLKISMPEPSAQHIEAIVESTTDQALAFLAANAFLLDD